MTPAPDDPPCVYRVNPDQAGTRCYAGHGRSTLSPPLRLRGGALLVLGGAEQPRLKRARA